MSSDFSKLLTLKETSDLSGQWVAVADPNVVRFEKALDEFSNDSRSESRVDTLMLSSKPADPWTRRHCDLFSHAVKQAPRAFATEPYVTFRNLIRLRDLAAEQNCLRDAFWTPLRKACELLAFKES